MPPYLGQLLHLLQARPPTPPVLLYPILHCLLFWIVQLPSLSCNLASSCPSTVHRSEERRVGKECNTLWAPCA